MSLQPKPHLSLEDWLKGERASLEGRSEDIGGELRTQTKGHPCQIYAINMKVRVRASDAWTYPDLVAFCAEHQFQDGRREVLLNPSLIVEVPTAGEGRDIRNAGAVADSSDSTEAYDRGRKFALYRRIPSLKEYLLVSQRQVQVELYTRADDGGWILRDFTALTESVPLTSLDCTLDLAEVYDKVEFLAA